jgi:hypothetical protein
MSTENPVNQAPSQLRCAADADADADAADAAAVPLTVQTCKGRSLRTASSLEPHLARTQTATGRTSR